VRLDDFFLNDFKTVVVLTYGTLIDCATGRGFLIAVFCFRFGNEPLIVTNIRDK